MAYLGKKLKNKPLGLDDYQKDHSEQIFFDALLSKGRIIKLYLVNGVKMSGKLAGSDEFTILISNPDHGLQMVYKHAIATISAEQRSYNE